MDLRNQPDAQKRAELVATELNVSLDSIAHSLRDDVDTIHCENLIGEVTIPLGIAGPLQFHGTFILDERYIPLATTEGALVASVHRGCKAITEAGGVIVRTKLIGATRGPIFQTQSILEAITLTQWIDDNFEMLSRVASGTSEHIRLISTKHTILGRDVYVLFSYDTDRAMGMNMVTIATQKISDYIAETQKVTCIAVAGNFDSDKKPSWSTFSQGRGRTGWAEIRLSQEIVQNVLKTSCKDLVQTVQKKCMYGSIVSGSLGYNAHFANIIAALYAATGQDLAHIVEGSHGVTQTELNADGSIYFSIKIPSIMVGTLGGGTKLRTQTEARGISRCETPDELAELCVGAVCAGELSLLAAISNHTLAKAHAKLGR